MAEGRGPWDVLSEIALLTRALKEPTPARGRARLAERARPDSWTPEEFLAARCKREISA